MKPLVLGGTGFIGLNIVKLLTQRGIRVRVSRRPSSNTIFLRKLRPELVYADMEDLHSLRQAMQGCDTVFMAAAPYPRFSLGPRDQIERALYKLDNVIQAAMDTGLRRLIYTSSVVTADWRTAAHQVLDEDHVATHAPPRAVYHALKIALERRFIDATRKGLPGVALCPTGCLGEYDAKAGTGFFLVALARGMLKAYPEGRINMVDVEAVARAHLAAAESACLARNRYLIGGHNMMVSDLVHQVCQRYDLKEPNRHVPLTIAALRSIRDEWECRRNPGKRPLMAREFVDMLRFGRHVSSRRAIRDLDLPVPPFHQTLHRAWTWFARYGYLGPEFKPRRAAARLPLRTASTTQ